MKTFYLIQRLEGSAMDGVCFVMAAKSMTIDGKPILDHTNTLTTRG